MEAVIQTKYKMVYDCESMLHQARTFHQHPKLNQMMEKNRSLLPLFTDEIELFVLIHLDPAIVFLSLHGSAHAALVFFVFLSPVLKI